MRMIFYQKKQKLEVPKEFILKYAHEKNSILMP